MQQVTLEKGAHLRQLAHFSGYGQAEDLEGSRPKLTLIQGGALTKSGPRDRGRCFAGTRARPGWSRRRPASLFAANRWLSRPGLAQPAVEVAEPALGCCGQDDGPTVVPLVTPQMLPRATADRGG
jgi:hypothetical protein